MTATTSPGGSGGGGKADWSPLAGKEVIIWPDNDKPGSKYAAAVLLMLKGLNTPPVSIQMVETEKLDLPEGGDIVDWFQAEGNSIEELPLKKVDDVIDLEVIVLEGGELPQIVDKCEEMLLKRFPDEVFQRGGQVVRVVSMEAGLIQHGIARKPGALQIVEVENKYLTELFARSATFLKFDKKIEDLKRVDPPVRYADHYLARVGEWRVPTLEGIIEAPTLRPDGTPLYKQGYDKETGLYVNTRGPILDLKDMPTESEALRRAARNSLLELRRLLNEFPFLTKEDESVALAAILTALIRKSIKTAPLFGFTAPTQGTGKSLLADVVSMIATGRPAAVMSQAKDQAEEEKRLLALLMAGDPVLVIDNIERPVESDSLCSILTQERFTGRILGVSRTATVPTAVTFMASGNNLVFKGDITRRALLCTIDAKIEKPDERKFDRNLHEYVPKHRGKLIGSALTALMAYHKAGRPDMGLTPYGGFEAWSDWVRSTLVWARLADPCLTRRRIEAEDPVTNRLERFNDSWFEAFEDGWVTVQKVINVCSNISGTEYQNLLDVLREIASDGKKDINPTVLGRFLGKYKDRIVGDLVIQRDPESWKTKSRWRVAATTASRRLRIATKKAETNG